MSKKTKIKRHLKAKKSNKKLSVTKEQRVGRFQPDTYISEHEWSLLVHQSTIPIRKIHKEDILCVKQAQSEHASNRIRTALKKRKDGSFVLVSMPARFDTANVSYEDGSVDPIDIIIENELPESTQFLGYVVSNGDGVFFLNEKDKFTAVPEKGYMFKTIPDADAKAQEYVNGFTSMVFDLNRNNIVLAVVKPTENKGNKLC